MTGIAQALVEAGATVRGKTVRCPFHDDHNPSGAIYQSQDGHWRYKCYACLWRNGHDWGGEDDVRRVAGLPSNGNSRAKPKSKPPPKVFVDWAAEFERLPCSSHAALAMAWGVSTISLGMLDVRSTAPGQYVVPMRNGDGVIVGLQWHYTDGRSKRTWKNARGGLYYPLAQPSSHPIIVCEGASDTAYALDLGYAAVGRYSALACIEEQAKYVIARGNDPVVIIADRDGPGRAGANRLAPMIGRRAAVITPPKGDLRSWAPTKAQLEAIIGSL